MAGEKKFLGRITHYFTNIGVAVVELEDNVQVGDEIAIEGVTTNFTQKIETMQIDQRDIERADVGQSVGLRVIDRVREGDQVFKM